MSSPIEVTWPDRHAAANLLDELLGQRLDAAGAAFLENAGSEFAAGVDSTTFGVRLSAASRHARGALLTAEDEPLLARFEALSDLWTPRWWTLLDGLRVRLILHRGDLAELEAEQALEEAFRYADEGELCALLRALPLIPGRERFAWRATEGCRTNMVSVFCAVACDSPLPVATFDDVAWKQALLKCLFVGAPLWRVRGIDQRLDDDLVRMALDYVEERRSAHRNVPRELWILLGSRPGERGLASLEAERESADPLARAAVYLALARAGCAERLAELGDTDSVAAGYLERARAAAQEGSPVPSDTWGELEVLGATARSKGSLGPDEVRQGG
jgi:hypothetical protein